MNEEQDIIPEENEALESEEESSKSFGKMGKIFLLAGIVLVQAVAAYALVSGYYPDIKSLTSGFKSAAGVYYEFDNIIINPAGSNGERYLILSITVELNSSKAASTIDRRRAEVQDRINTAISKYTSAELTSLRERDAIKKNVGIVINKVLNKKAVRNLFFTKYVLQ